MNPENPKRLAVLLGAAILISALSFTLARQAPSDQETDRERGIRLKFKSTRKNPTPTPATARKSPPAPQRQEPPMPPEGGKTTRPSQAGDTNTRADITGSIPIGIGYTLYKCIDKLGRQCKNDSKEIRVDTNGEVQTGDIVYFTIEPNIDGFLYIFNAVNNDELKMIYPFYRIEEGDNKIQAHVLYKLGWFEFVDKPDYANLQRITENIYVIVTRKP